MSIKTSQAILKCFIDLKSSVWFTLGSEDAGRQNRVLWHLELFSARLPVKVFKILNGRQSYILSKFHKSKKIQPFWTIISRDPDQSLYALVGSAASGAEYTSTLSCRRFCEIYWEYRTAGHLVLWKPWPAVELKKVASVTKHGFVLWAQRKPNTRLEIYKAFQDRLTFLNRHMIV